MVPTTPLSLLVMLLIVLSRLLVTLPIIPEFVISPMVPEFVIADCSPEIVPKFIILIKLAALLFKPVSTDFINPLLVKL